ncbi:MAG: acyl-CoA/acyl-ACP dehydrogenase [Desulfobacteraceae bacterium]|nr:acyl-CoA/acyl-ACP dehydrogenase [Desulfobacteraceae bacterium]
MDFRIPQHIEADLTEFKLFLKERLIPEVPTWLKRNALPSAFFQLMGRQRWYGFTYEKKSLVKLPAIREALITEALARVSPGMAVAALAHVDLGLMGLYLYGTDDHKARFGKSAVDGETIMCIGNTENIAGSDVAGIGMSATRADGGWVLNGSKAYVTNGSVADLAVVTAVSDPKASRSDRLSMFLVALSHPGIRRTKLNKGVWLPSDLTRLQFTDVFVPDADIMGHLGHGLQQVLDIFTHSRVSISALTLGTAAGAFDMAVHRSSKRKMFGSRLMDFQSKAFEMADYYARMEAARLMIYSACESMDKGLDFGLQASMAKYLSVDIARTVSTWAADLFGAASVIQDHPIHKFPMDAWAASLGEGTQDVQKLVIFRQMLKQAFPEIKA